MLLDVSNAKNVLHVLLTKETILLLVSMLQTKDLIVEDKQGIGQALKADSCQKHTSFADNFIFFKLVARKQTADSCHKHISFADNFIFLN